MKVELLPSSFGPDGAPSPRQHLACLVVDDRVAIDAGSLAFAVSDTQRSTIRDIVLTHAHLDHVAGLPLFIDDLFATLESPVRIRNAVDSKGRALHFLMNFTGRPAPVTYPFAAAEELLSATPLHSGQRLEIGAWNLVIAREMLKKR